ncbi:hypothetical protein K523DRAFT_321427, partial [Schizophyllum commune Tattone D]
MRTLRAPPDAPPDSGVARCQAAAASSIVACIEHGTRAPPCERNGDGAGASENPPTRTPQRACCALPLSFLPAPSPCTARVTVKRRRDGVGCTYTGAVYAVASIISTTVLYTHTCTR